MQNKLNVWFIAVLTHSVRGLWTCNHYVLCSFYSPSSMLKLYCSFNPLWTMNTTVFQPTSSLHPILEPIFGRLFQKLIILGSSPRSSFIDLFTFAKKRCNTVLAPFSFSRVINYFPFFPFSFFARSFLIFMVTSDWVLNRLRICIAYKFNFQRKRNELYPRRVNELQHPAVKILSVSS